MLPLEEVHCDFWLKLAEFYRPFRKLMLNQQNAQLISHIGLVFIKTWRMHYLHGLFALVISRNLALDLFSLVPNLWTPFLNL